MITAVDVHTHIQLADYDHDRRDVVLRAKSEGVGMIVAGTDAKSSCKAVECCAQYPSLVFATVGIHPTETYATDDLFLLSDLLSRDEVIGVGECGLDYFHEKTNEGREKQLILFEKHIIFSHTTRKPLIVHCREAFFDARTLLSSYRSSLLAEPGIAHFFTGTIDDARALLDLNFSFTVGGLLTFNHSLDDVIRFIPRDHILVETDAPFVAPAPFRGTRNEPSYLWRVINAYASLLRVRVEEVAPLLLQNTQRIFGKRWEAC